MSDFLQTDVKMSVYSVLERQQHFSERGSGVLHSALWWR